MCKVFAMTNMANVKVNAKFINSVKEMVCKYSDDDGFGYALLGQKGTIGGERSMKPDLFRPLQANPNDKVIHKLPIATRSSDAFGKIDTRNPKAFIAHGRLSTNTVSLRNTHPFTNGELALVHNGVVQDPSKKIQNLTTNCDTEILLRYWENGGMDLIEENVTGYYAMAVLDKMGLLHIVRDDKAMLYISYSPTVDSFIISTTPEFIRGVAKANKWKIESPEDLFENSYAIFDGSEIIDHKEIFPRGSGNRAMTAQEKAALGKTEDYSEYGGWGKPFSEYGSTASESTVESDPAAEPVPDYREATGVSEEVIESERDRYERVVMEREMDEELARQMAKDEMPALDYDGFEKEESDASIVKRRMRSERTRDVVEQINKSIDFAKGKYKRSMAF